VRRSKKKGGGEREREREAKKSDEATKLMAKMAD
jgi:hypothetical protein